MIRLQEEGARYIRKIEVERKKVEDIEKEIATYQEKILDQKARLGGVNAAQINNKLVQRQIRHLENRMDKNLTRFNEILCENRVLRQKIDDYRRERVIFDAIYKKLERELHEKKKEMTAIIEDSKMAYKIREKAQEELTVLQQRSEKDKMEYEVEFFELGQMIKSQQHMLQQMRLKQFDKAQEKLKSLTINAKYSSNANENNTDDHDSPQNGINHWNSAANSSNLAGNPKDKAVSIQLSSEKMMSYEDAIRHIQESTGIYDVNEIVAKFLEAEEQNFSLFNYVNDVNSEVERLEHHISDMRNQIEKYRGQGMSTDSQRKKNLRTLEEKLAKTDKKVEEYDQRYQSAKRVLDQLKNGIHSIFTRIGASSSLVGSSGANTSAPTSGQPNASNNQVSSVSNNSASAYDEMLGNQGVTESNMMQYLGLIEQRTAEILQAYAASQASATGQSLDLSMQLPTVIPADSATKFMVQPPSYDDISSGDDSEDDQDERPLTRLELEKRSAREIARKAGILNQS
jgi:coiled-coil domain-containing protein 63/114